MDQEGKAAAKNKVEQLLKSVESEKLNAIKEKKAENIEKAKQHLQLMKQHQAALEELYALYPHLKPKPTEQVEQRVPQVIKAEASTQ